MPSYTYVAKNRAGKLTKGMVDALNPREAASKLRAENLLITEIKEATNAAKKNSSSDKTKGRVPLKDKLIFLKQFSVMNKAGLGMVVCLNNLVTQTSNPYFRYLINQIRLEVEGGESLSGAVSKYPKVFDKMFIHLLEAGEASGKLDVSLERLHDYYDNQYQLKKKVTGAMVYPAVIVGVAVTVVIILITVVLPMFKDIFEQSGAKLPGITQFLLNLSDFFRNFWFALPLIPLGIFFGFKTLMKNPEFKTKMDQLMLKIPVFGDMLLKVEVARFTRTFGTLLDSGVPMLKSLEIVERSIANNVISQVIHEALVSVNRGTGLAHPLEASHRFPPMLPQMVSIGEETGDLSRMLGEVADFYDKEVGYAVENITTLIEPMIIVGLGGTVAFIVAAIMLPMFQMSSGAAMGM